MNSKVLNKIKKLLRLAKSANEHEASAAMSRAQKLMQEHGLTQESPQLSDVMGAHIQSKFKAKKPASYFALLSSLVAKAFGCHVHFNWNWITEAHLVTFTGHNERPEIATYAYEVLERQLIQARKDYIATLNKRIKRSTKIARADVFCEAWVSSVYHMVKDFALSEAESTQLDEYVSMAYPDLKKTDLRQASPKRTRGGADDAAWAGHLAGKNAKLSRGVQGKEQGKLEASNV